MMKKVWMKWIETAVLVSGIAWASSGAAWGSEAGQGTEPGAEAGLFSWHASDVKEEGRELLELMDQQQLNVLYQNFSVKEIKWREMVEFLGDAMAEGVSVYHLAGDPSWALEPEGESLCEEVEFAASLNRKAAREFDRRQKDGEQGWDKAPKVEGILFDVEPYVLEIWDEDRDRVMAQFTANMKKAYALAGEQGLKVIVCIPWFYDNKGEIERLKTLMKDCGDGIAVMNYYRGAEIKNIRTEEELARQYQKKLITIYELQPAGSRGVQEMNTYYEQGLSGVRANFEGLLHEYGEQSMTMALHDYRGLKEVLKR